MMTCSGTLSSSFVVGRYRVTLVSAGETEATMKIETLRPEEDVCQEDAERLRRFTLFAIRDLRLIPILIGNDPVRVQQAFDAFLASQN